MNNADNRPAVVGQVEPSVRPSTLAAFVEALHGRRGDLDAWLECNSESGVRAHVLALVKAERARWTPDVDECAQHIRWLNGSSKMGAGKLAEKLVDWLRSRA